jgi:F-type H+-transporting ATPase subunit b
MSIDWITVSAQIVNFLILVWLLKRFLYHPVIRAMESREQRIADRLNEAQAREQEADAQRQQYQEKQDQLEKQRDELLAKAKQEAEQQKKQLLEEARDEVAESRAHWQRQTLQEKDEFLRNLRHQTTDIIQAVARKALADLADAELEAQIVHSFVNRLKSLDTEVRKELSETSEAVRITSSFPLDSTVKGNLTRTVHESIAENIDIDYTESPELLCGIELTTAGRRLGWSVTDYLEELTERIEAALAPAQPAKG